MKRISIPLLLAAAMASTALGQPTDTSRPARRERAPRPAVDRRGAEQGQIIQRLQKQISDLRTAHQDLIADLRVLRATADREKATETVGQIDKLISRQQQDFREKVQLLERQLQRTQTALRDRAGNVEPPAPQGRRAADFSLSSFDGKTVKLADYKGKIVVLEWFNMDCPFVQYHYDKASTMIDLANKYKDKGVVWLAINGTSQTTVEANRAFAAKHKLPYPILDDRAGTVGRLYGAITTPHMFIISTAGEVVYDGAIDNAPNGQTIGGGDKVNYVDKALAELISDQAVSTPKTQSYGCSVKYPTP
ncbi:MAG: redoxin domain-containing protein [Sedimentisphaerales bacterium]|nr:redoxin domain-containing protein [Sedimentisphaerales bacterium]